MTKKPKKQSTAHAIVRGITRELIIPIVLALIVIQFVIQAFRIPTGSMENHLLVGDFLLGLKFVYGVELPFSDTRISISEPEQGDVVIFRYPGDPVIPDYDAERYSFIADLLMFGKFYYDHDAPKGYPSLIHSPESPKDFIKRCVAVGGQTIQIIDKRVFVDGTEFLLPKNGKFTETANRDIRDNYGPFTLPKTGDRYQLDTMNLKSLFNLKSVITQENPDKHITLTIDLHRGDSTINDYRLQDFSFSREIIGLHYDGYSISSRTFGIIHQLRPDLIKLSQADGSNRILFNIHFDFFREYARTGFIPVPMPDAKGAFTRSVSYTYFESELLNDLERNITALNINDSTVDSTSQYSLHYTLSLDDQPINEYTVKENTFFMMGDNRHNSDDSRFWGVVSNTNIKAKAFITYFSFNNPPENSVGYIRQNDFQFFNPFTWYMIPGKIRWSRIGKLIHSVK